MQSKIIYSLVSGLFASGVAHAADVTCSPAWNKSQAYEKGQSTSFDGKNFDAKWWTQNESPASTSAWSPWQEAGACGVAVTAKPSVTPIVPPSGTPTPLITAQPSAAPTLPAATICNPAWNKTATYTTGKTVTHQGRNYQAKWWNQGAEPSSSKLDGEWKDLGACAAKPSATPTTRPTAKPTAVTTPRPSATATARPTTAPTAIATPRPTAAPTAIATPRPTAAPTAIVTARPTVLPTKAPTATPAPTTGELTLQSALNTEARLTDNAFFRTVKASIRTLPNARVDAISPGNPNNPKNVKRVEAILGAEQWEYLFPRRDPSYSYTRFLQAVAKFPAVCDDYLDGRNADQICRTTLATMFAHFAQETGDHNRSDSVPEWRQGLKYLREMGHSEASSSYNGECSDPTFNQIWTCGKNANGSFKGYFGRGAKQLSYNYNYGPFSQVMFDGDQHVLLQKPELVADTWLNLASATFFFVFPQPPKASMLHVIDGTWVPNASDKSKGLGNDFATTIQIITAECGSGVKAAAQNRINYYKEFGAALGVAVDPAKEAKACSTMQRYDGSSSAAYNIYWEMDWSGKQECKLVGYQTPYSALIDGNYVKCVEKNFNVKLAGPGVKPTPLPTPQPTAVVTPVATAKPVVTPTAVVTTPPVVKPSTAPTVTPVVTIAPVLTPTPIVTAVPSITPTPVTLPTPAVTPAPSGNMQVGSYFAQWGIYGRNYQVSDIASSGAAKHLTFINYAFGNLYQKNGGYECGIINKLEPGATDPNAPDAGTGGDAWADYAKGFAGDTWGWPKWDDPRTGKAGPLKGNFNQLKKLKAQYPDLKVFISLGGWTWSKWFSNAASTDALRKQLVKSCIDVYIRGNVPFDPSANAGGKGVAEGVFDGIDIDWEFPGVIGQPYNTVSPNDKQNFTLLLAEFRKQLDAIGVEKKKRYPLTVAIGVGKDKIDETEPAEYAQYLDWINLMTYDFNGAWAAQGPTDFQSHLYADPASPQYLDPKTGKRSLVSYYNVDDAVSRMLAEGVPAKKLVLGVPFYGRGWQGVDNKNNGLYQKATGGAKGTYEAGVEDYKVLKNAPGQVFVHPVTKQSWKFDGNTFWSYDTPAVIQTKVEYVKQKGLGGAFSWSLDGDSKDAELTKVLGNVAK